MWHSGKMGFYREIVQASLATTATMIIYVLWQVYFWQSPLSWGIKGMLSLAVGLLYTQFFQYIYHRIFMHEGLRCFGVYVYKTFRFIKRAHGVHHSTFKNGNFQSNNPADFKHITAHWYLFPLASLSHYLFLTGLALLGLISVNSITFFALGTAIHFLVSYEIPHWLTHFKNNPIDKIIFLIPIIGELRKKQIEFHWIHHIITTTNFQFTVPPRTLDKIFGTFLEKSRF